MSSKAERSEQVREEFPEQTPEQAMDAIRRDISWQNGWDAAIDAAAKVADDENNREPGWSYTTKQNIVAAILALKGDRNVEQSGTE